MNTSRVLGVCIVGAEADVATRVNALINDQHDRLEERLVDLAHGTRDKHAVVRGNLDAHAFRHVGLQHRQQRLHGIGDLEQVRLRLAQHGHAHRLPPAEIGEVAIIAGPQLDPPDVAELDLVAVARGEDEILELVRLIHAAPQPHREFAGRRLDAPARQIDILLAQRALEIGGRELIGRQARRIDPQAHRVALPAQLHRSHARNPPQVRDVPRIFRNQGDFQICEGRPGVELAEGQWNALQSHMDGAQDARAYRDRDRQTGQPVFSAREFPEQYLQRRHPAPFSAMRPSLME